MKKTILLISLLLAPTTWAADDHHGASGDQTTQIKAILKNMLEDNASFAKNHSKAYFSKFADKQTPRATVVACSDSRVHSHALDKTPDGDLFFVRNIGNQLSSTEGSIEYGVRHLNTPLLIFIGHANCGAIKAASGDYASIEPTIKKELDTIKIPKGGALVENTKLNVNNQVAAAMQKFAAEIEQKKLAVVGAVYDFANLMDKGYGQLNIININGETDIEKIKHSPLLALKRTTSR